MHQLLTKMPQVLLYIHRVIYVSGQNISCYYLPALILHVAVVFRPFLGESRSRENGDVGNLDNIPTLCGQNIC